MKECSGARLISNAGAGDLDMSQFYARNVTFYKTLMLPMGFGIEIKTPENNAFVGSVGNYVSTHDNGGDGGI